MEGDRSGLLPGIVSDSSFAWGDVSKSEFRSFIIFWLSKVTDKIASSLLGRREESQRGRQRK